MSKPSGSQNLPTGGQESKERPVTGLSNSSGRDSIQDQKHVSLNPFFKGMAATEQDFSQSLDALAHAENAPISVYLHIPFSPYQLATDNTHSVANHGSQEVEDYINSIEREIQHITDRIGRGRSISQLHLGGNAPNSISKRQLVKLQEIVERHFQIDDSTETSLAADAGRTSFAQMELLNGLGFKQVNFGICDLDSKTQEMIGRVQSPELVKEAFAASREAGFELVTSDLIYGVPCQTVASMHKTVERYLDIQPDRIVCRSYQAPTNLASNRYRPKNVASLADKMATFHAVVEGLTSQGYEWVGLDCFAKSDDPISSRETRLHRNRIGYSTLASSELLGFGSEAITEIDGLSIQNHAPITDWSAAIDKGHKPMAKGIQFSGEVIRRRAALSDLMCSMQTKDVTSLIGDQDSEQKMREFERDGMIEITDDFVSVTPSGLLFLSQVWDDIYPSNLPH